MPTVDPSLVSRPATKNVTELARGSPVAARCPSTHAVVTPPAQMPSRLASALPVIEHATSSASRQPATYVSRFQSRWAGVGLRQLTAKKGRRRPPCAR